MVQAQVRGRDLCSVSGAELSEEAGREVFVAQITGAGAAGEKSEEKSVGLRSGYELIFAKSFYVPTWKVLSVSVIISETEVSLLLCFTQFSVIDLEW